MAEEKKGKTGETVEAVEDAKVVDTEEVKDEGPGKRFEFADVYFYCNKCGNDAKIADALRGISFTVPATEKAEVKFECTECGNVMKMYFKESSEEAKEIRRAEIAEQEQAYKEQMEKENNNGIGKEDKEVRPEQGNADDSERATETDEQGAATAVDVDADRPDMDGKA